MFSIAIDKKYILRRTRLRAKIRDQCRETVLEEGRDLPQLLVKLWVCCATKRGDPRIRKLIAQVDVGMRHVNVLVEWPLAAELANEIQLLFSHVRFDIIP